MANTVNTPPLDVKGLRTEWDAIRQEARALKPAALPSLRAMRGLWADLETESARQRRSVFETSSMMAVAAVRVGAVRAGQLVGAHLLDHYRQTLNDIREVGYAAYAARQCRPYVRAAVSQFSPERQTLTERLIDRFSGSRGKRTLPREH